MKKMLTLFVLTNLLACLGVASPQPANYADGIGYAGPDEKSASSGYINGLVSLGSLAHMLDVGAVAEVIGVEPKTAEYPNGFLMVRVVNSIYGCTNGQELVVTQSRASNDPNDYPTNNSRIVFVGIGLNPGEQRSPFTAQEWRLPVQAETIHSPTNATPSLFKHTRSWWYDGYQDDLPYTHLTNLVHVARRERNWTNFYHVVRDAIPSPSSPRVWMDSYVDLYILLNRATEAQFEYMSNDPLFPVECQTMKQVVFAEHQVKGFPTDD